MPVRIYFDSCSLGRLTDDQSLDSVRIQAGAVNTILDLITAVQPAGCKQQCPLELSWIQTHLGALHHSGS
jgi:hypothetical protein